MNRVWKKMGAILAYALVIFAVSCPTSGLSQTVDAVVQNLPRCSTATVNFDDGGFSTNAFSESAPTPDSIRLFKPYISYSSGSGVWAVGVGDFNHDGLLDVAASPGPHGELMVFHQNRIGDLEPPDLYAVTSHPESLGVGDFNGDGRDDVVIAGYNAGLYFFLQDQDAQMILQPVLRTGDGPAAVAVADFNHDGKDDVAESFNRSNFISVFYQSPGGLIDTEIRYPARVSGMDAIDAGDINGDGLNDLVMLTGQNDTLAVYVQNVEGLFDEAE
jgi:hypothetical protein